MVMARAEELEPQGDACFGLLEPEPLEKKKPRAAWENNQEPEPLKKLPSSSALTLANASKVQKINT